MDGRLRHILRASAIVTAAGLAALSAACGGTGKVAGASSSAGAALEARAPAAQSDAQLRGAYLGFARCMRSHGVHGFPDPITGSGGHPGFRLQAGSSRGLGASSPAFRQGVEACQHILGHEFRFVLAPGGVGKGA